MMRGFAKPSTISASLAIASRHVAQSDIRYHQSLDAIERLQDRGAVTTLAEQHSQLIKVDLDNNRQWLRRLLELQ
jgi:hypothetical protein